MENILLKYMIERFNIDKEGIKIQQKQLPFITISREYGCSAKDVAYLITSKLNSSFEKNKNFQPWTTISKEILQAASVELNVDASRISKVFNDEKRGTIDEILNALSEKYYQSDRKILKTIDKIIIDFASNGNAIIVGRGGMSVTRDLSTGLHIRLFAPLDWRIQRLMEKGVCKTVEEAKASLKQIDLKRNELLKSKSDSYEDDFDIFYNCKYLSVDEMANSIINLLQIKKLI